MGALYEAKAARLMVPMMEGERLALTHDEQSLVGRWILKTALLFRIREALAAKAECASDRQSLSRLLAGDSVDAATNCNAWLAHFEHNGGDSDGAEAKPIPGLTEGGRGVDWYGLSTVGQLAMLVITSSGSAKPYVRKVLRTDPRFVEVWPPSSHILEFPPPKKVHKSDIGAIRAQLGANEYFRIAWGPDEQITRRLN